MQKSPNGLLLVDLHRGHLDPKAPKGKNAITAAVDFYKEPHATHHAIAQMDLEVHRVLVKAYGEGITPLQKLSLEKDCLFATIRCGQKR